MAFVSTYSLYLYYIIGGYPESKQGIYQLSALGNQRNFL